MTGGPPHRVAYVIGELNKGGAEYQLHELLRFLDRRLFAPEVWVLSVGGWWTDPIRALGIGVHEIPRRGSNDAARVVQLRRALRTFRPRILHTILWSGNTYGRLAAAGLGIPAVVAAERNVVPYRTWQVVVGRLLDRVTDAYLVNCEAIAAQLTARQRVARPRITIVPNGIDIARVPPFSLDRHAARAATGFDAERRLVAQVGRLSAQKDFATFLRAAATVAAEMPDVDFLVVGEGEERADLENLARGLGLGARVRFLGLRHDVPALLGAVDVLTLTSLFEGFPNVVLEAMAAGAVAVATDVGGCGELVVPEETGLLVPPRTPAAVAAAVLKLLRDPSLCRRMATAARRRVEAEFAVEVMARRTAAVYAELLGEGGASESPVAAA